MSQKTRKAKKPRAKRNKLGGKNSLVNNINAGKKKSKSHSKEQKKSARSGFKIM